MRDLHCRANSVLLLYVAAEVHALHRSALPSWCARFHARECALFIGVLVGYTEIGNSFCSQEYVGGQTNYYFNYQCQCVTSFIRISQSCCSQQALGAPADLDMPNLSRESLRRFLRQYVSAIVYSPSFFAVFSFAHSLPWILRCELGRVRLPADSSRGSLPRRHQRKRSVQLQLGLQRQQVPVLQRRHLLRVRCSLLLFCCCCLESRGASTDANLAMRDKHPLISLARLARRQGTVDTNGNCACNTGWCGTHCSGCCTNYYGPTCTCTSSSSLVR